MSKRCLACGACCAYYRCSFYWSEAERFTGGATSPGLTVKVGPHHLAMAGTEKSAPRCVALEGKIGASVRCTIYAQRPAPCREFKESWLDGVRNERCDKARAAHGLPPLEPVRPERRSA